jgi:hypothetical protein
MDSDNQCEVGRDSEADNHSVLHTLWQPASDECHGNRAISQNSGGMRAECLQNVLNVTVTRADTVEKNEE